MTKRRRASPRSRFGSPADLPHLLLLERSVFGPEAFSEQQLRYLLTRAQATTVVIDEGTPVVAAATVLWRRGSSVGRIYSFGVSAQHRRRGHGSMLLKACERIAVERGCSSFGGEIRADNAQALDFFVARGFRAVQTLPGYYKDRASAVRVRKSLILRNRVTEAP